MQEEERTIQAAAVLPARLRRVIETAPREVRRRAEEIRVRCGGHLTLTLPDGEYVPPDSPYVTSEDLLRTIEGAQSFSAYASAEQLSRGFLPLPGGHRLGICGTGVVRDGHLTRLRDFSSLTLRIARAVTTAGEGILPELTEKGRLCSTLILSPPGGGKTTLLRDLIRRVSDGIGVRAMRVGVADERGEIAAVHNGVPALAVGARTDVVSLAPRAEALLLLLRGMGEEVLAADEITEPEDCRALLTCAGCGVTLLTTAHAESKKDLLRRGVYRTAAEQGIFERLIVLRNENGRRSMRVERWEGGACEN